MAENKATYDEKMMLRCFELAVQGESYTAPNPMVGAVLVHEGRIIGEGYHQRYGEAHAEVNCLNSVKNEDKALIAGSTLYVSLEPCSHHGKTPPCTDLILQHRIPKVVISVQDTFHLVNGTGIERLRANGVEVISGVLEEEGKNLIRHFLHFHQYRQPYVTLKFACSADGYLGVAGKRIAISGDYSRHYVHHLRAQHQAILVGKRTVLADNPELTLRYWKGKNPLRVVLGNETDIPGHYHIFNSDAQTLFIRSKGHTTVPVPLILDQLREHPLISVLVEGGAHTLEQFIRADAWQEAHILRSDLQLSDLLAAQPVPPENFIKAPELTGVLTKTLRLSKDTIQVLKNPNVLSHP